jgi:hypothetical protein
MRSLFPVLLAVGLLGCRSAPKRGEGSAREQGYQLGSADTVKRLYWAKQALEAPSRDRPAGRIMYYAWEESGVTRDGRKLAPETVGVPVFIPDPVSATERRP